MPEPDSQSVLSSDAKGRAALLLSQLTLAEKIGQMVQVNGHQGDIPADLRQNIVNGSIGSVLNEVNPETVNELQRLAREQSPHGIPLLIGRDVIHGFKIGQPIPLGQAATWNPGLVEAGAQAAAMEASQSGINWTFSPMVDICRDPRWGRVAEGYGEDPVLTSEMGKAMVRGYQNGTQYQLLSCLKHFAGYGASESGRDYNTTSIPELELQNVYFPPFLAGIEAGCLSLMPSFSDLNGLPPSGNPWLMRDILRKAWGFQGFVVSDWESISQLQTHGICEDRRGAASQAVDAGINLDMASHVYAENLQAMVESGQLETNLIDDLVLEILATKYRMGLFDSSGPKAVEPLQREKIVSIAQQLAEQSMVLLKNADKVLPLNKESDDHVLLVGPMADQPLEQLGTWVFDVDEASSITLKTALSNELDGQLSFHPGLQTSRDQSHAQFQAVLKLVKTADVVILALGEEAILSGEAHCRTDIRLPGAQEALISAVAELGKPVIAIVMAGRPLVMEAVIDKLDAVLYAWHPGSMAGPALVNVLLGNTNPSGKLPMTIPRAVGQIPIYYAHGNTGKPATPETVIGLDDIDPHAPQLSVGNTSFHLDVAPSPLFCFGFGLSYTQFAYRDLRFSSDAVKPGQSVEVSVLLENTGPVEGVEVAQLYIRDPVASVTRPVRQLKQFQRVALKSQASTKLVFTIQWQDLSFFNGSRWLVEAGVIEIWVGGSSAAILGGQVQLVTS